MEEENKGQEVSNNSKVANSIKRLFFRKTKRILIIVIVIALIITLLGGSIYVLKLIRNKEDKNNVKNAPAAVRKYTNGFEIDKDGNINMEMSIRELWEELVKNDNDLTKYIKSAEDLAKIINIETVTKLPYLGKDPENAKIDTSYFSRNVDSKNIQGIIKFKRATDNGEKYLEYKSPKELQELISKYNKSGSEKDRDEAMSYFTLEKRALSSSGLNGSGRYGSEIAEETIKIIEAHKDDFDINNFEDVMAKHGGYEGYLKSLGGVFAKYAGKKNLHITTVSGLQEIASYVYGLMTIWGFDYYAYGDHYAWWGENGYGTPFYPSSHMSREVNNGSVPEYDIDAVCSGQAEGGLYSMTNNCAWGVTATLKKAGILEGDSSDIVNPEGHLHHYLDNGAQLITNASDLRPGDLVYCYEGGIDRSNPPDWGSYFHIFIVVEVNDDGSFVGYDSGRGMHWGAFLNENSKVPYRDIISSDDVAGNRAYDGMSADWAGLRLTNLVDDSGTYTETGDANLSSLQDVLVIGDSITWFIEPELTDEGATVIAHGGTSADFYLGRTSFPERQSITDSCKKTNGKDGYFDWDASFKDIKNPSAIYLMLGGNDPSDNGISNLKELTKKLQNQYPNVPVYISSILPFAGNYSGSNPSFISANEKLKEWCDNTNGIYYSNIRPGYEERVGELTFDGMHPEQHGEGVKILVNNIKTNILNGGTSGGIVYTDSHWPSPTSNVITSRYGPRNWGKLKYHYGLDIGAGEGTDVEAAESGVVVGTGNDTYAGNYVTLDHGNGIWTRYQHLSAILVNKGDKINRAQVIGKVGHTGKEVTGAHLHFAVLENVPDGTSPTNYSYAVDPLKFKYDNGMGDQNGGPIGSAYGSNNTQEEADSNQEYKLIAKVAKFTETRNSRTSTDPSVEGYSNYTHRMSLQEIDYLSFVNKYRMPFNYLWSLLLLADDTNFIFDIANLVYESDFVITVKDNIKTTTNIQTNQYAYRTDYSVDNIYIGEGTVIATKTETASTNTKTTELGRQSFEGIGPRYGGGGTRYQPGPGSDNVYRVVDTTVNTEDTLDISLTLADSWIAKTEQEYTYEKVGEHETSNHTEHPGNIQTKAPFTVGGDPEGEAEKVKESYIEYAKSLLKSRYQGNIDFTVTGFPIIDSITTYTYTTINRMKNTRTLQEESKYTTSPEKTEEKTDRNSKTPNFVTIFCNNYNARSNILSVESWLFRMLSDNEDTKDMVDITKYLLFKATGKDYGVTDFNTVWEAYIKTFESAEEEGGKSGIDGVEGQIYDFLLAKGVPAVGAAAIMGNVQAESSFNPANVNPNGGASGLFQWYNPRVDSLKKFASSKGKQWTDVDIQMEFLWKELNESYPKVRDTIMSAKSESELEYATWYWGTYFERYNDAQLVGYEASRNRDDEQTRYKYAQNWYKQWQEKHTSTGTDGVVTLGGISTQLEADALTAKYNNMLNTTIHSNSENQGGPYPEYFYSNYGNTLEPFQCTWWAWGRASMYLSQYGTKYKKYPTTYGNGGDYYTNGQQYFNCGKTPKPNSIISMTSTGPYAQYGHVAYVEGVTNEGIYISHANAGVGWRGVTFMSNEEWQRRTSPSDKGFVYLNEPK